MLILPLLFVQLLRGNLTSQASSCKSSTRPATGVFRHPETLMFQAVLAEKEWMVRMADEDFRALTPLIHYHVNRHCTFELDMTKPLPLDAPVELLVQ